MSELTIRRSVPGDAQAFKPLIERVSEMLMSRYQRIDLSVLLEECIFSLTVLAEDTPVAIACFQYPPDTVNYSYRQLLMVFFACETQNENDASLMILRSVFDNQPTFESILTLVSPTSPIEQCLAPHFSDSYDQGYMICKRSTCFHSLVIREARIQDYDDLMPLFQAEAADLVQAKGTYFVSDLIKDQTARCLVATLENDRAVGFASIEPNFDASPHAIAYDLSTFQDLCKTSSSGIAFRITLFFIADEYRAHSREFMKEIFALMRGADYCLTFLPTDSAPFPLAPFFTRIPAINHGSEKFNMYLCHRDSISDVMLNVRSFAADDLSLVENFIEPLLQRQEMIKACEDTPQYVFELLANEIIVGIAVFDEPQDIDHQKWDIEEFVDISACKHHAPLKFFSISPLFQRFISFFLVRSMENLKIQATYMMHTEGRFSDVLGTHFFAIERRQGPASKVLKKHLRHLDSMHLFPRKLALQQKLELNTSIVIVGSTEGVAAFIYKLISTPYLHFSSIHVICTGGAERVWVNTAASREYSPDWLQHLFLLNGVNFFESDLNEIDRENQQIILDDGNIVSYDYLILLTAKEGEIADMWMAKNFVETTCPPVSVVGDSLVAYYILSHYPGCAHIAHNPRFKLEGTHATIIKDSTVAYCDFKEVPPKLLSILEASSLVYDGGIVIDELFRTNDTHIFAAGPITMFSRLYRVKPNENIISQTEYGLQIGSVILRFVDPVEKFEEPPQIVGSDDARTLIAAKGAETVPKFSTKRAEMYQLPGNRVFYRNGFPSTGCKCIETQKNRQTIRFFIDPAGFIQAFEYLGDSNGQIFNWNKFIGLPQVLLNNMLQRYEEHKITDFAAFFSEPWCAAILHDRFRKFFDLLGQLQQPDEDADSEDNKNRIREALMQFLEENSDLLPDYFTSESQLPQIDDDDEESIRAAAAPYDYPPKPNIKPEPEDDSDDDVTPPPPPPPETNINKDAPKKEEEKKEEEDNKEEETKTEEVEPETK